VSEGIAKGEGVPRWQGRKRAPPEGNGEDIQTGKSEFARVAATSRRQTAGFPIADGPASFGGSAQVFRVHIRVLGPQRLAAAKSTFTP